MLTVLTGPGEAALGPAGVATAAAGAAIQTSAGIQTAKDLATLMSASSPGKMQKEVDRGQAPDGVTQVHKGRGPYEKDHVHFGKGEKSPALNKDGTWKHNPTTIPKAPGWNLLQ
jgi:hypothetical protein